MIACQPLSRPEISGTLTGIESDTLLVQSFPVNDRDSRRTDTVAMQNGSFAFNLGDSVLKQVYIYGKPSVKPNEDGSIPAISMKAVSFFVVAWPAYKKFQVHWMNINWREVPFMTIIMKWWRTVKHIVIKIDSLNVVCMDMEKKEYPEILSVKFMPQQKNGMEIF